MPVYKTEALSLRLLPFEETGGFVTLLTSAHGKIKALAKGIRKPQSSLAAAVQPGSHSVVSIVPGRNLDLVTQARLLESFPDLHRHLLRLAYAIHVLELLDLSTPLGQEDHALFSLAVEVLRELEGGARLVTALAVLQTSLLHAHGVAAALDRCAVCGASNGRLRSRFSVSRGGRVCDACSRATPDAFSATPGLLSDLQCLDAAVGLTADCWPASVSGETRRVLERLVIYHLGVEPKSTRFLQAVASPPRSSSRHSRRG